VTPDELVRDYLAKGGAITRCPSSHESKPTKPGKRNPWWIRSNWTLVKVPGDRIAPAEAWLKERGIRYYKNLTIVRGRWHVRIEQASDAVLFKLTWGGS
jgi:hypothetical protein